MATSDLIAFVRARIDDMDTGKRVPGVVDHLAEAMRKIVNEYERVDRHHAEILGKVHPVVRARTTGHRMGVEHAVVAIADMWRGHADWRGGWW